MTEDKGFELQEVSKGKGMRNKDKKEETNDSGFNLEEASKGKGRKSASPC